MTLDISSESANIKPKKRDKATNIPAIPTPEAPNTFPEHPPTNNLHGRARAASSRKRSTRNFRNIPAVDGPGAEAGSHSAGSMDSTLDTASAEFKVTSAVGDFNGEFVSATPNTAEARAFSGTNGSSNNVHAQSITLQRPGIVAFADETNPDTEYTVNEPALGVSRSAIGTNEAALDGLRTSDLRIAAPYSTDLPPASTVLPAAEATSSIIEPTYHDPSTPEPEEQIQILDLHTHNPLISYQKQLYSCTWTSTIGTDLLLASSSITPSLPILKHTPAFNILAASGIKLIGRPVRPILKEEERFSDEQIRAALTSSLSDTVTQRTEATNKPRPVTIPIDAGSSIGRQNQARFLERLIAIKAAKCEKDKVTVYAQKTSTATRLRAKKRTDREALPSDADMDNNNEGDPPASKFASKEPLAPRVRRGMGRVPAKTRAKGGLFRDYRPKLRDEVGADIERDDSRTPRNWTGLPDHREDAPTLANGCLDAAVQPQMMENAVSTTHGMVIHRISRAPTTEHVATSTTSNLASFRELDQDLMAQDVASPAAAAVPKNEIKDSADAQMEDAPS